MQLTNSETRYGLIPQALHWLTVIVVAGAWMLGQFGDALPKGDARSFGLFVHNTMGLSVVVLVVIRLAWRFADPPPALEPTRFGRALHLITGLGLIALYGLLLAAPIAGIVLQFARGNALPIFGLWTVPSPWPADHAFAESAEEVHELLANALLIVAGLHAAAALFHHWLLGDRTLTRMLPGGA